MIRISAGLKEVGHEPEDNNPKKEMRVIVAILIAVDSLDELRQALESALRELVDAEDSRQERSTDLFDQLCYWCECPIRVKNAMTRLGVTTIEGLYRVGPTDLLRVHGVGPTVQRVFIEALRRFVSRHGLDADRFAHWFI